MSMKTNFFKRSLSMVMAMLMVLSCWVWFEPAQVTADAANDAVKDHYLFAYFTGNSSDGQTIHLAVSEDGLHYTALRNNEPVIIPSKGTGAVRDPYIWYNEQDNYYYIIGTDMDASGNQWWDNCNGFIMWRSKDLVHWYDETFINVYDMLQRFNQKVGIVHRAWAPQILWDGQSYIVYFSIDTDNVNYPADQLSIVYLKTTDLMDLSQYYEYGGIYHPGFDVNDADIIQHPTNGKWYLFYKPEATDAYPTTKINMMVSDNATGPYTTADAANDRGLDVFSSVNESLEGGNGYFDNEGNFVMYADAYGHGSSYFYIAKTPANGDFTSWTVYGEDAHNINSLSPRHGSVIKITEEEYNTLLNNAYGITSSSFSANENLEDHLIARYFTTSDPSYNAANGNNDLTIYGDMTTADFGGDIGYYANFDGSTNYAEIDLENLKGGDFNCDDGFTITFTALASSGSNSRFYEIADNFGQQTDGVSHYTHFAAAGDNGGSYIGNYNGPSGEAHKWTAASANYNDGQIHEYIVSYANGNTIVYCDGNLIIKMNRFDNAGTDDDAWYSAIRNATLWIGKSGWSADPLFAGAISDFCIYDCSMSYYDVKTIQNEQDVEAGLSGDVTGFTGTTTVPSFQSDESVISTSHYANIIYSPKLTNMPEGSGEDANPDGDKRDTAAVASEVDKTNVGIYYAKETVMFVDGIDVPKMPVMIAARLNSNNRDDKLETAYPTVSSTNTADNSNFYLTQNWYGWTKYGNFSYAITNPDGSSQRVGHNSATRLSADLDNSSGIFASQKDRDLYYYASVLALNEANVTFNSFGYQKYNLSWYWDSQQTNGYNEDAPNNNIWVIDLRDYVAAKNEIANEYNSIVTNSTYCSATISSYKAIVEQIMKFNAESYDYASGVEAAVKECSTQAQKLADDYNTVKAQLGPCKTVTIPGREATCEYPGLTEGSYCEYCGTVFAEQTITEKLPHTFGEKYAVNGVYYIKCSTCSLVLECAPHEVRFENLFSLSSWNDTDSKNPNSGTINVDFSKDMISFTNGSETTESVSGASGSVSRAYNLYSFPVTAGEQYVLEYTLVSNEAGSDIFIFYYDKDGNHVGNYGGVVSSGKSASNIYNYSFTPVEDAAYAELRFDSNDVGETVKFANIGVYTKESYDTFAKENPYSRLSFTIGDSIELFIPKRIGYEFLGWYTANGTKVENTNQLDFSATVYAKWRKAGNAVLYNNNLFDLTEFAKSNDYKMQSSVLDGHVYVDFSNSTFNTVSARDGLGKENQTVNEQLDTYNTPGSYKVPVTAGEEYVFTATVKDKSAYQFYLWFYDANGNGVIYPANNHVWINHSLGTWTGNTIEIRFTIPDGATQMSFRMGSTGKAGFTQTFSNIGLYSAADYEVQSELTNCPAMTYVPEGSTVTLATPNRSNYKFENWYTQPYGKGTKFTSDNTSAMTDSTVVYANWYVSAGILDDSIIVVDFGIPTTFNPFDSNDEFVNVLVNSGRDYSISAIDASALEYGTVSFNGKTITYTPTTMMNEIERFTYTVNVSGQSETVDGTVVIMPATVVYYEDDVDNAVTYTDGKASQGTTGKWTTTGSSKLDSITTDLSDKVYGYDEAYNNTDSFSMNSAHVVSVSKYNNPNAKYNEVADNAGSWPVAEFTFAGTGFDLVSLISKDTGAVEVKVLDSKGTTVRDWIVDTYYGYTHNGSEWVVDENATSSIYQIPVISNNELAYGTYTVQVIPTYTTRLDHDKSGSYDFYLDAIRVYNPMGNDIDAATIYINNGEYVVAHQNIRDILIDAGSFGESNENQVIYINPGLTEGTFEQYSKAGPKNEVYLAKDQSVAFNMTVAGFKPSSVQISAHSVDGTASMRIASGASYSNVTSISHKTTLYYNAPFTAETYWKDNGDGTYSLNNPIVIKNEGDGLLSLCNIKVTSDASASAEPMMFMMSEDDFNTAVYSVNRMSGLTPDDSALFVPDDMTSGTDTDVVEKGEDVLVTITTSSEVYALTVNGENATLVSVNEDGSKVWNYTFTTAERGEKTFTLVAYDVHGFASEETTVTVDVQSKIEIFFNKLTHFFKMIVEILDNIFGN